MGRKKPTTNGIIVSTGTPVGLNKIINYISTVLNVQFNYSTFPDLSAIEETIFHVFGLADKYEDAAGTKYPVGYNQSGGTLTDPINLLPSDRWPGFMFFDYDDPTTLDVPKDYQNTSRYWSKVTVKLNLVFFFNMKRQKYYVKWGDDYRIQKEYLSQRILRLLTVDSPGKGCQFKVNAIIDRSLQDVFKGYTIKDLQGNLQPYYAIRFETEVTYNPTCGTPYENNNIMQILNQLLIDIANLQYDLPSSQSTGNVANAIFPTFFEYPRVYEWLVITNTVNAAIEINGGTTPGGTELFSNRPIGPLAKEAIYLDLAVKQATPFYLWSDNWNGCSLNTSTISHKVP